MFKENSIAVQRPDLVNEWNYEMNTGKLPEQISLHDNRKYYWICPKGHNYQCSPDKRSRGSGCPYCSNKRLLKGFNDLATNYPLFANEWDNTENIGTPEDYTIGSTYLARWICSECGHIWSSKIRDRVKSKYGGCPECAKKIRGKKKHEAALQKSGGITDELLLKEWDYEKNIAGPECYAPQSNEYAYWICSKCGEKYRAIIRGRANGRKCPVCAGKKVVEGKNDLASIMPELAQEWDQKKNGCLTPSMVTVGSGKKVWWLCPKGHSYKATVLHRTYGTGCPECNYGRQTSFAEQAAYYYVRKLYPDAMNRYKADFLGQMELDIFIPSISYAIEYDGTAWHGKDKLERERTKYSICRERNIKLIRLIEKDILETFGSDNADRHFGMENLYQQKNLRVVIDQLLSFLDFRSFGHPIDVDLERDRFEIYKFMTQEIENSFETEYPALAEEWDYEKNGSLKPFNIKPHSDVVVWWKCRECGTSYKASVGHRSYGTGCPLCGIRKSAELRSKAVQMIDIKSQSVLRTYVSISEAARDTKISSSNITMVCKGTRKSAGGFAWKYTEVT